MQRVGPTDDIIEVAPPGDGVGRVDVEGAIVRAKSPLVLDREGVLLAEDCRGSQRELHRSSQDDSQTTPL
jgi:hypothetical protein